MKALSFKIPKVDKESFIVQNDKLNHLYDRLHTHPEIQVTYILESSGTRFIGHNVQSFKPNEIYLIGPDIPHMFRNHQEYYKNKTIKAAHCISIFFREESFGQMFHLVPELAKMKELIYRSSFGIKIDSPFASDFKNDFVELEKIHGFDRFQGFLTLMQKLAFCDGLELLSTVNLQKQQNEEDGLRLNKIITYITTNFSRRITVEDVAKEVNLSTSAFCRYFKLHTRKSFISFLNEFRIGLACKQLTEKDTNISEVCYQTGFNNISNFNRQFKSVTGYTPSQYLQQTWL